jgi:hypothetical protein
LLDANNPFGSIAKLLRQSAEKATKIHNSKADDDQKIKQQRLLNLHIARQSEFNFN